MRGAGHDLDTIVDEAIRQLDEFGLPDLTMRRLASALGVQPSALYWHVDDKQTLLAAVADRIVAEARSASRPAAAAWALRDALLAHRDGAEVVLSTAAMGLGSHIAHDLLRDAYATSGSARPARDATVLLQFVLGHTSLVQQRLQAARIGAYDADPRDIDIETRADFEAGLAALT